MTEPNLSKMKKEDISCPHCGKKGTFRQDNPSRPFCSERCKLIDLGAWADEQHRIPEEKDSTVPQSNDDSELNE